MLRKQESGGFACGGKRAFTEAFEPIVQLARCLRFTLRLIGIFSRTDACRWPDVRNFTGGLLAALSMSHWQVPLYRRRHGSRRSCSSRCRCRHTMEPVRSHGKGTVCTTAGTKVYDPSLSPKGKTKQHFFKTSGEARGEQCRCRRDLCQPRH